MHLRQVKLYFLPLSFSFSHLKARENYRCGVLVVCSIHAHVQHLMHLRQSDLHVFSFYFPCPTSRFGKTKLWVVVYVVKFNLFSCTLLTSYLKTPENVIVGAGVSYLCKITTSRAPASSQITFSSSVVFLFPPQNSKKCRCGVLVVCSIHAHVPHTMHLRQSDLHIFSFYFPCPTSRFGKTKLWVVVSRLSNSISSVYPSHFLPQNSGKCNCRGWGVIFVQNYNISFLCRFPFPTSKLEKM